MSQQRALVANLPECFLVGTKHSKAGWAAEVIFLLYLGSVRPHHEPRGQFWAPREHPEEGSRAGRRAGGHAL